MLDKNYLLGVKKRLSENALKVLQALVDQNEFSSKEDLSLKAGIKRYVLDDVIIELFAIGFINREITGKSITISLTPLGKFFFITYC